MDIINTYPAQIIGGLFFLILLLLIVIIVQRGTVIQYEEYVKGESFLFEKDCEAVREHYKKSIDKIFEHSQKCYRLTVDNHNRYMEMLNFLQEHHPDIANEYLALYNIAKQLFYENENIEGRV